MSLLRDRVTLVTGGSSGIGLAAALAFGREGAKVVIASRGVEQGEAAARRVREQGGEAVHVAADVSDSDQVADISEADFDRTIAVNLAWVERYRGPAVPLGRLGRPEECAELAVWLCSDAASYATGLCIPLDGGLLADAASYQALRRGGVTSQGESIEWPHR